MRAQPGNRKDEDSDDDVGCSVERKALALDTNLPNGSSWFPFSVNRPTHRGGPCRSKNLTWFVCGGGVSLTELGRRPTQTK